jgi:intracellular septation protein A
MPVTLRAVGRHALPSVVEGTVAPLVVFTALLHTLGLSVALWGCLAWSYGALVRRLIVGRRVPGILVLSAVGVSFRMVTMWWTGSAFLYFAQPVLATVATAVAFAVSVFVGRPLASRLGADLVPLPDRAWADPEVGHVCSKLSAVWSVALLANAALTLWLLSTMSVPTFVLVRPVVPLVTTVPAIVASILAGKKVMRRSGARLVGLSPLEAVSPLSPLEGLSLAVALVGSSAA